MWLLLRFTSCRIVWVGIGAEREASTALLSESTKHFFLLWMCSLSCLGILLSPILPGGLNLLKLLIRGEEGSLGNNLAVGPGASRKSAVLFGVQV